MSNYTIQDPVDSARHDKRVNKRMLSSLKIAETFLEHIVTELITFSNEETDILLKGLREQIEKGIVKQELLLEMNREIISMNICQLENKLNKVVGSQ